MKTIVIILRSSLKNYPPILSLISSLDKYNIIVISGIGDNYIETLYKNVTFYSITNEAPNNTLSRIILLIRFRKLCNRILKKKSHDLIWCATADTAIYIKDILFKEKYILNIFELYDKLPYFRKRLLPIAQKAVNVIVPEYNRANILRVWFDLKKTPIIIPNKLNDFPKEKNQSLDGLKTSVKSCEKIILYQGVVSPERDLDSLCKAISELKGYTLLIMGKPSKYLDYLINKYKFIKHQEFITPPRHLDITSYAYIGIVTYNYNSLNTIFCAPNKIWEYSCFGIPMLGNTIPGLINTIEKYKAGICTNMEDCNKIKDAIIQIDKNYLEMQSNSRILFNSINIYNAYNDAISKSI